MKQTYWSYLLVSLSLAGFYTLFTFQQSYAQTPTASPEISETATTSTEDSIITPAITLSLESTVTLSTPVASPQPSPTPEIVSTPTALPTIQPTPTSSLPFEATNTLSLTFAELGEATATLNGPADNKTFNIGLPTHWEILPGSSVTLFLDYTRFGVAIPTPESGPTTTLADQIVNLQIKLNGEPVYQTTLTTLGQQSLTVPLPDRWPKRPNGNHSLEVSVNMGGEGSCEESALTSVTIFDRSFLTVGYRQIPLSPDLASYPSPIYQPAFLPSTAYIVLPDQPSNLQLEAGLALAAGLGNLTNDNLVITATTDSAWDQANPIREHLILVGTPDSNGLIAQLNDNTALPASLHSRRMELTTSGPNVVAPNAHLTYAFQVTNTEATSTTLGLRSRIPPAIENVNCEPDCQLENMQVSWDIDSLASKATSTYTLSFVLPATFTLEAMDLTSELVEDQEVINVSTLRSPVQLDVPATLTHTEQVSDLFFMRNGQAIPETDGIIEFLPSPWQPNKAVLMVTGLTEEAVFKAGRALGTTARFPGMQGQIALVQEISQQPYIPLEPPQEMTLVDLGYQEDRVVNGVGDLNAFFDFNLPLNWVLTEAASVRLLFSHSELLDPTRSSLNLIFNNTPIASVALDEENAVAGELTALLPPKRARPGRSNRLMARVEMRISDPCADPNSPKAWIVFNTASSLSLPHGLSGASDRLDLDFLPLPFSVNPNLADLLLALPEQPSAVEYTAAMRVVSHLANASDGDNFHPAALLGDPVDVDLSASHLIVIGRPSRSPLLQMVNEMLPQPFLPGMDTIQQQVDEIIFRLPPDLDLGYIQLIPSNWNPDHELLAITGTSDQGVAWAARTLNRFSGQLKGNLALVQGEEILTMDTREFTKSGHLAAMATAIPQATIIDTSTITQETIVDTETPTPPSTPSPTIQTGSLPDSTPSSTESSFPTWLPLAIGGSVIAIFIILGIAYWQSRRRGQLDL